MVIATFYYRAEPALDLRLSRGYGEADLAHQLLTMIMCAAELPLLLDWRDEPVWVERDGLLGFAVAERITGPGDRLYGAGSQG